MRKQVGKKIKKTRRECFRMEMEVGEDRQTDRQTGGGQTETAVC